MKQKVLMIFAAVMFLFTVTSCSNEVDDTAVSTAPELEKFESVENEILKLNQSYEDAGGYNTRKIKLFKKIWRALTVAVADAGSFILSGFNVSTAVTVSKNINDIYKSFEGEVQQEALKKAPLNGLEPGSPGYIHNEAIIRLYQKYGDNLDSMDTRELVNATMQEVADITGDESYARPTKTTYDVIDIFVTKMDFNKSISENIEILKTNATTSPVTKKELDICGAMIEGLELVDDDDTTYYNSAIAIINNSELPESEKQNLQDALSVAYASAKLWTSTEVDEAE